VAKDHLESLGRRDLAEQQVRLVRQVYEVKLGRLGLKVGKDPRGPPVHRVDRARQVSRARLGRMG